MFLHFQSPELLISARKKIFAQNAVGPLSSLPDSPNQASGQVSGLPLLVALLRDTRLVEKLG